MKMVNQARRLGYAVNRIALRLPKERYYFGDYLMGIKNRWALIGERKKVGDLVSSTMAETFFRQVKYMVETAEDYKMIPILFIVGSVREWRSKEELRLKKARKKYQPMTISKIEDAITNAHVRVLDVAPTLIVRHITSDIQMIRAMYNYGLEIDKKRIGSPLPRPLKDTERKYSYQVSVIATNFNLPEWMAKNIIDYYDNYTEFIESAKEQELRYRIKGLGRVNAEKIMKRIEWLRGK